MITLFVGDNQEYLASAAKQHDPQAFLVDHANWSQILKSTKPATVYTSLSDLPKINDDVSVCWELMQQANVIHYVKPTKWSDHTSEFSWTNQKTLLEYYLWQQQLTGKKVLGLDLREYQHSSYLDLQGVRSSDQPMLWIAGCSITHGIGVEPTERYGHLLAQDLHMPECHLTRPGASVEWAADQILRSDIRNDDTVIWGLTQEVRAPRAVDGYIDSWGDSNVFDVEYLMDETRFYKALNSVYQVINFCAKIGCRLLLLPLISSEKLIMHLIHQPCLVKFPYQVRFTDYGSDGVHPGPQQHRIWADTCRKLIHS